MIPGFFCFSSIFLASTQQPESISGVSGHQPPATVCHYQLIQCTNVKSAESSLRLEPRRTKS